MNLRNSLLALFSTLLLGIAGADPSYTAVKEQLTSVGLNPVRATENSAGGVLKGDPGGSNVIFTSSDAAFAMRVLTLVKAHKHPGDLIFVYGTGIKLKRGDFLVRTETSPQLAKDQISLPSKGPSVDHIEFVLAGRKGGLPLQVVASEIVLALQNGANTSGTAVFVHLSGYDTIPEGLKVRLSLRTFEPEARAGALNAIDEGVRKEVEREKLRLISYEVTPVEIASGWARLSQRLAKTLGSTPGQIDVIEDAFNVEHFGRPGAPSVTLSIGQSQDPRVDRAVSDLLVSLLSHTPR